MLSAGLRRFPYDYPYEVQAAFGFWVANLDPFGPPTDFISLLQTCRPVHDSLIGTPEDPNPHILAQVCRYRFDTAAPERRMGVLTNQVLAEELKTRCPTLRRIAAGVIYGEHVVQDAWISLLMLLENDGRNRTQLDHAGVARWAKDIILFRTQESMDENGWPKETELIQLAAALLARVSTRASVAAEPEEEGEEILRVLYPFMFAGHRYPISYLPITQHVVGSTHPLPPDHVHTFLTMASAPIYPPRRLARPHFGREQNLSPPLVATSAIVLTNLRLELLELGYRSTIPETRAQAITENFGGATKEDYHEANRVRREALGLEITGDSRSCDADWWRMVLVHKALDPDPEMDRQLQDCWFGTVWEPGMFTGNWIGRALYPNYPHYTRMLAMHPLPLAVVESTLSEFQLHQPVQPMQLTLREHISTDLTHIVGSGDDASGDGIQNGWFPEELDPSRARGRMRETGRELVVIDPREPSPEWATKRYQTWYPGMDMPAAKPPPFHCVCPSLASPPSPSQSDALPSDVEMDFADEDMSIDDDAEMDDDSYPTCVDVIITGETDSAHGDAWGAYDVYGRVRRNDGLIVIVQAPRDPARGRWIFRGYTRGGRAIVGRWRETGTNLDVMGYEGSFVLCKVDEDW